MSKTLDIKKQIAEYVLKVLKAEIMPWRSNRGIPSNPLTGRNYSGINVLILDAVAAECGYRSKYWATYEQWHNVGMQVSRRPKDVDSWGVAVVNWKPMQKFVDKGDILSIERYGLMQKHSVFNTEQVFGRNLGKYFTLKNSVADYLAIESLIAATGVSIQHESTCSVPHYHRPSDCILLPLREVFLDDKQFVATKIHELFHWAESRTAWKGSEDQGELVAEIGTGYLETAFNLPHDTDMANCRKCLPAWIYGIEKNPQYLFNAAAQAARAIEYIIGLQPEKNVV